MQPHTCRESELRIPFLSPPHARSDKSTPAGWRMFDQLIPLPYTDPLRPEYFLVNDGVQRIICRNLKASKPASDIIET